MDLNLARPIWRHIHSFLIVNVNVGADKPSLIPTRATLNSCILHPASWIRNLTNRFVIEQSAFKQSSIEYRVSSILSVHRESQPNKNPHPWQQARHARRH